MLADSMCRFCSLAGSCKEVCSSVHLLQHPLSFCNAHGTWSLCRVQWKYAAIVFVFQPCWEAIGAEENIYLEKSNMEKEAVLQFLDVQSAA